MANMITLPSKAGEFPVYEIQPESKIKGGLIVIHEVWGLTDHIKDVAERFGREGYLVLAPDLMSETGIYEHATHELAESLFDPKRRNEAQPKLREIMAPMRAPDFAPDTMKKLRACFESLAERSETGGSVAVTGYCFGGSYSFSLAVEEPRLKVAIPFYGHAEQTVDELKQIKCPVRAFYGEKDKRLMNDLPELKEKMQAAGVDFDAKVYEGCGHAFFNDTNRFAYNQSAAQDAWQQTLAILDEFVAKY